MGRALAATMPSDWETAVLVLATPVLPSAAQLDAALAGTGRSPESTAIVSLGSLARRIEALKPDLVLIATRGPVVRVIIRAIASLRGRRPVLVTGLPGLTIPAVRKAIAYRSQADLVVLHSKREIRDFTALALEMGVDQRFGLARLPFIPNTDAGGTPGGDIVFAAQAKVPGPREDRLALLGWLAETARRHPERRVVVKVRAVTGEQQTHAETYSYADLMQELTPPPPQNLVVEGGPMAEHLARAGAVVTVSSTAAIEAAALGIPTLVLEDFGVSAAMINLVFVGSGLLGGRDDLVSGRFKSVDPAWGDENYLHTDDDGLGWLDQAHELLARRDTEPFPLKPQRIGRVGWGLRRAWERKNALGPYDVTLSGQLALVVGVPARWGVRRIRRLYRALARVRGAEPAEPVRSRPARDLQGV